MLSKSQKFLLFVLLWVVALAAAFLIVTDLNAKNVQNLKKIEALESDMEAVRSGQYLTKDNYNIKKESLLSDIETAKESLYTPEEMDFYVFGNMIKDILELNLKYPQFNDPHFTNKYPDIDSELKNEYDIYAMMIWNCIGLISLEYSNNFEMLPFKGAVYY